MTDSNNHDLLVTCPCCNAVLRIDPRLGEVISHETPPKTTNLPDLDRAAALLKEQAEHRELLFKQGTENEKVKSQLLERKFQAAFEKSKDEPITKPIRDIDL
jgi:hypothetical protein